MVDIIEVRVGNKVFDDAQKAFDALAADIREAPNRAGKKLADDLRLALERTNQAIRDQHSDPWRAGRSQPDRLFRRIGRGLNNIARTIDVKYAGKLSTLRGRIGAKFPMSVHEDGATIRATSGKFLTIPLPDALDSHGVPLRRSARQWQNTFVARSKRGNLIIFQRQGVDLVPLYLLRQTVKLPPRLNMFNILQDRGVNFFEGRVLDRIDDEIGRTLGL